MPKLALNEYYALLRQNFCGFIERSFYELNPRQNWKPAFEARPSGSS